MAATTLDGLAAIEAAVGSHLGVSEWLEITQERVNTFAEATGDHQWIHVDAQRAASGPFGAPIAHGYLTLSLSNLFLPQIVEVTGFAMGVNYGTDTVRFPSPVKVGESVRGSAELVEVTPVNGGVQTRIRITIEVRHADGSVGPKPACVIDSLSRWLD